MYTLLNKLYFNFYYLLKKHPSNKSLRFTSRFIASLASFYFNSITIFIYKHFPIKRHGVRCDKRKVKVIASLTSFPARIETVWITIETIMRQNTQADEIVLWLADSQFNGVESLPQSLRMQIQRGLTIKFCEDIRSHKKYYYSMVDYPNDIIVTFDDDMFYPYDTLEKLLKMNKQTPTNIVCSNASLLVGGINSNEWIKPLDEVISSSSLSVIGCGGVLYPPNSLPEEVFNKENIFKCAPNADDLWLTIMAYMNKTKISCMKYQPYPLPIKNTQEHSLFKTNNSNHYLNNERQWELLKSEYANEL